MAADDMLSWLRSTITADLAQAKAADEASPGPWVNTGQDGLGDAWQIHGAPIEGVDTGFEWSEEAQGFVPVGGRVATLNYDDGGGVWKRAAADHIVLQQPHDTIARCEAELAMLDKLPPVLSRLGWIAEEEGQGAPHPDKPGECMAEDEVADYFVKLLASGYRHRPGFQPEWVED